MNQENSFQISGPIVLLRRAISFYRQNFVAIFSIVLLPVALSIIWNLLEHFAFSSSDSYRLSLSLGALALALVNLLAQIAFIDLVHAGGGSALVSLRRSWAIFLPFLWVTILAGLASAGAALLLLIPGIIISIALLFSSFVVVAENRRGLSALALSWQYVKGHWWRVLGYLLILAVIGLAIVMAIVFGPFTQENQFIGDIISSIIAGLILSPIGTLYLFYLYQELRAEKLAATSELPVDQGKRKWLIAFVILGLVAVAIYVSFLGLVFMLSSDSASVFLRPSPASSFAGLGFASDLGVLILK